MTREANVVTNKRSDFGLVRIIETPHDMTVGGVVNLSLDKVKKPRVERIRMFKDDSVCAVVFTASMCGIITLDFTEMEFLQLGKDA